jgi:hypothetical protein
MNKLYFIISTVMLSMSFCFGQTTNHTTTHYYYPDFMKTIYIDELLKKDCICFDKEGNESEDDSKIDSCKTFLVHNKRIYNSDSSSTGFETRYKILLATYKQIKNEWIKNEYAINGQLLRTYSLIRNPDKYYDDTDTLSMTDPRPPYTVFDKVITFYNTIEK